MNICMHTHTHINIRYGHISHHTHIYAYIRNIFMYMKCLYASIRNDYKYI